MNKTFSQAIQTVGCLFYCFIAQQLNAATFTYYYDPLNRLTNATYSDGSRESYAYDPAGNRLSRVTGVATIRVDTTPPSVPTNLVLTAFTTSQFCITWNRAFDAGGSGLAGYFVYINGSLLATTTNTNFLLNGLMPNSSYCVAVATFDHDNNISAPSLSFCTNTAAFQPPILYVAGLVGSHFQVGITSGTPGPYNVLVSTQLPEFTLFTNILLPQTGTSFMDPATGPFSQRFFRLSWNTNTP